jgi:parallel beta-helix repeat protein
MFALTGFLITPFIFRSVKSQPSIWIVDDDGPADFNTITDAIEAASPGDTIRVRNGVYREEVVVNKNGLRLIGEEADLTIIDGEGKNVTVVEVVANDVVISGFTIENSGFPSSGQLSAGIRIFGYANVTGNIIKRNKIGIHVNFKCIIVKNQLFYNGHGISLVFASEVVIEANYLSANTMGISLTGATNNRIIRNKITKSSVGGHGIILLQNSNNNNISGNILENNSHGMWLSGSSKNFIVGNTVTDGGILGIELTSSPNNTLYHNNFLNNSKHIVVNMANTWDYGPLIGGNFWDNYKGTDENGDGFGDLPYIIDSTNEDQYPLIFPRVWNYSNAIPVIWAGKVYYTRINSNLTVNAFLFSQLSIQISFNLTGPLGTLGYCNITIPKALLDGDPWTVTVNNEPPKDVIGDSNDTHSSLYFTYLQTVETSEVIIKGTTAIPEFKSIIILLLVILLSMVTFILKKTKFHF